jgi:hypothetical protein
MFTMLIVATVVLALLAYAPDIGAEGAGQRDLLFKGTRSHDVVSKGVRQNGVVPIGGQLVMLPDGTTRHVAAP